MNLEGIILSEIRQVEKGKYCIIYVRNKKKVEIIEIVEWWLSGAHR